MGAFQNLSFLYLQDAQITGSFPAAWAQNGSFPSLTSLSINNTQLSGSLPDDWGWSLQKLSNMFIAMSNISGMNPFHDSKAA